MFRSRTVMLPLALLAALPCARAAAQGQTTVPPEGEYKVVFLVLEKGGLTITPTWGVGVAQHDGDLYLRGACRDGKVRVPGRLSVRQIVSELAVDKDSIKGLYVYQGPRTAYEQRYAIDAAVRDGRVSGTWKDGQGKTGAVRGVVKTEADLRQENAFATKADWPDWSGPFTSMAAAPCGLSYAAFFEDRVVLSLDGSHGHSDRVLLGATPETFRSLGHWVPPHPQTTSYHNKFMTFPMVEGRIFFRGYDGIYCYDLRRR